MGLKIKVIVICEHCTCEWEDTLNIYHSDFKFECPECYAIHTFNLNLDWYGTSIIEKGK